MRIDNVVKNWKAKVVVIEHTKEYDMKLKNEIGNRYDKLTVIEYSHSAHGNAYWLCACDCGLTTTVKGIYLRKGHTTSCGCVKRNFFNNKHGYSDKERLYGVWEQMHSRCNNPNNPRFDSYGGKGVSVCDEWSAYAKFRVWAYESGYKEADPDTPRGQHPSIDRIDSSKGYSPDNCRWVTVSENNSYRFTTKPIRGEGPSKIGQPQRIGSEKI